MKPDLRLKSLKQALIDDSGQAVLLDFAADNGRSVKLEVDIAMLPTMLKVLYGFAQRAGEIRPPSQALKDVPLPGVLLLPCEEIETRSTATGALWLLSRIGVLDTAVALPDLQAAQELGRHLLTPAR